METAKIRKEFVNYFTQQGHSHLPSSSLVPADDKSLLFTNSGMVQFKSIFSGTEKTKHRRATTVQRCLRAGGKHNDLESVGFTSRHHTYFEMLGNFSFGDYFKREAIHYAYECLTKVFSLPPEKLIITISDEDTEAEAIWLDEVQINPLKLIKLQGEENFWQMGDVGPCGYCSEIFYDFGDTVPGGPPGSVNSELDRFTEIWNIVFMQYYMDAQGNRNLLEKPAIDTGMGLERLSAVLQGVTNNFETNMFRKLISQICDQLKIKETTKSNITALRVIADHLRAVTFLMWDGILPNNEGRGYVLRRIIRRAIGFAHSLGHRHIFLHRLVSVVFEESDIDQQEWNRSHKTIASNLQKEEELFDQTLERGLRHYNKAITKLQNNSLPGHEIFKLYDTYGFPVDLVADLSRQKNITLDMEGYHACMQAQKNRGRRQTFAIPAINQLEHHSKTTFIGYETLISNNSIIVSIIKDQQEQDTLDSDSDAILLLDSTPFYAEAGGQVGDIGELQTECGIFTITDTTKSGDYYLHHGHYNGSAPLTINQKTVARVDQQKRRRVAINHSATHLLHKALQQNLGENVTQRGSLVADSYIRFDFAHDKPLSIEEINCIEEQVNKEIEQGGATTTSYLSIDEAKQKGAIALFGEKYSEPARVLSIGNSIELCGGTHVSSTQEIGAFSIIDEKPLASGIRRIVAITAPEIRRRYSNQAKQLYALSQKLECKQEDIFEKCYELKEHNQLLGKEVQAYNQTNLDSYAQQLLSQATKIRDTQFIFAKNNSLDHSDLKFVAQQLTSKDNNIIQCTATNQQDKAVIIIAVSRSISTRYSAKELAKELAPIIGTRGGGRDDLVQFAIDDLDSFNKSKDPIIQWIKDKSL